MVTADYTAVVEVAVRGQMSDLPQDQVGQEQGSAETIPLGRYQQSERCADPQPLGHKATD